MARIIKFRIRNYKSIEDSGDCYLSDEITVLAGKNESGKTSILEALEDFDTNQKIRETAIPLNSEDQRPEIEITFEVFRRELKEIYPNLKVPERSVQLTIIKDYEGNYSLKDRKSFLKLINKMNENLILTLNRKLKKIKTGLKKLNITEPEVPEFDLGGIEEFKQGISDLRQVIEHNENASEEAGEASLLPLMEDVVNILGEIQKQDTVTDEFTEKFKEYVPNIILFETHKDQKIPNVVPFEELDGNEFIQDLAKISNLDLELIKEQEKHRQKLKHRKKINIRLSNDYKEFWSQDQSTLYINWEDKKLFFWVCENDEFYSPEMRSKGKQWHLAFYVKVTARAKENVPNILLIDEPGLFLHAKAQKDILKKLEETSREIQMIFSTHSPYLIDPNQLDRIRLVCKSDLRGTKISKVHAKADKETLTPILTAIGEDLSQGIRVDIKHSYIVEGISDYYYIHAFRHLMNFQKEINIIPGCGDNIPAVATILFGWGLDPFFILDSDDVHIKNRLKKKLNISDDVIIPIIEGNGSVENLFSEGDFKKIVLHEPSLNMNSGIIDHIKEKGLDKVLLSKQFIDDVRSGKIKKEDLSTETTGRVETLFKKISKLVG